VTVTWPNGNVVTANSSSVITTNGTDLYNINISCTGAPSFIKLDGLGTVVYATAGTALSNVYYTLNTDDGEINGIASNVVMTDMVSYFSDYSNINYVILLGKTTNSNCTVTCSTSSILTVKGVDVGFSSDGQPFFSDYYDGSQLYDYTITIKYDPTLIFTIPNFTTYALIDNSINYTKIPITLYEFINNTYVVDDIILPFDQYFGNDHTVITGNTFVFDNTHTFDTYSDATYGVAIELGNIAYGVAPNADMTSFENGSYIRVKLTVLGQATYLTLGHDNIIFGPPSTILSSGIATPDFTNQGQYIMNIYNGYFSNPNTPAIFDYYGGDHIQNYHVIAYNGDVKQYDVTVLNLSVDPQYFTLYMSDGTNVQDITFTAGDLIQIPNFYNSNTAIGNYKTATL
jgi:hypothetical protein